MVVSGVGRNRDGRATEVYGYIGDIGWYNRDGRTIATGVDRFMCGDTW